MRLDPPPLPLGVEARLRDFLVERCGRAGARGGVVGLSGGIDSAVVARLARDALGRSGVVGVGMPDGRAPGPGSTEVEGYARALGIEYREVAIGPTLRGLEEALPELAEPVALGNAKARLRMTILYAIARSQRRLVFGTGNRSEILLGYFTKYGDGGVDLQPIGRLYKSQVRELAGRLGLPATIRDRPPSAGLWPGQTDEGELGLPYEAIDRILVGLEASLPLGTIAERSGLALADVRRIGERVEANRHKRSEVPTLDWEPEARTPAAPPPRPNR